MLQYQTVRPVCLALLKELMALGELKSFRLVGGTALSLRLGHRISIDLDFFTNQILDIEEFTTFLEIHFNKRMEINGSNRYGVFTTIDQVKVDFLYRYEKFLKVDDVHDTLRLASLEDIGAMKIQAASSRASKKDLYDLYELLNVFTFAELMDFHRLMYPNYEVAGVLRSLSNFSETDADQDPESLKMLSWNEVKEKIATEIKEYIHLLQQKRLDAEHAKERSIQEIISRKKNKN